MFSEAVAGLLLAKRSEELKETIQCYARCYKVTDMERDLVVIQAVKEIPLGSLVSPNSYSYNLNSCYMWNCCVNIFNTL